MIIYSDWAHSIKNIDHVGDTKISSNSHRLSGDMLCATCSANLTLYTVAISPYVN